MNKKIWFEPGFRKLTELQKLIVIWAYTNPIIGAVPKEVDLSIICDALCVPRNQLHLIYEAVRHEMARWVAWRDGWMYVRGQKVGQKAWAGVDFNAIPIEINEVLLLDDALPFACIEPCIKAVAKHDKRAAKKWREERLEPALKRQEMMERRWGRHIEAIQHGFTLPALTAEGGAQ